MTRHAAASCATIIIAVGSIWLLMTAGAFLRPLGYLIRAWPALLIVFRIDVLVGRRGCVFHASRLI